MGFVGMCLAGFNDAVGRLNVDALGLRQSHDDLGPVGLAYRVNLSTTPANTQEIDMTLTPLVAVHLSTALAAVAVGPIALWARKGTKQRPRLHRAFGYAWVTLMLMTAVSASFIRDFALPNLAGFTPIHLLVPFTLYSLFGAFYYLFRGNIRLHSKIMQGTYVGACLVAGGFTLLPNRYLGQLVWGQWLGLL